MRRARWRLGALLAGLVACLGSGVTPPGKLGEGIRYNRECRTDVTALFYSELENMPDLEAEVTTGTGIAYFLNVDPAAGHNLFKLKAGGAPPVPHGDARIHGVCQASVRVQVIGGWQRFGKDGIE